MRSARGHLTPARRGATTTAQPVETHVLQYVRPSVPGHDLWRKPRAGDRLRGRRLPARHPAHRGRHPALPRQAPAGPVALHHPAAGAGPGPDPLGRVQGRADGRAGHDRHADRTADRERRPALEGLFRHPRQVPARPRRLRLRRQIRLARLSRRRPPVGARDRDAGRGRRDRAQDRAGHDGARRADPDGIGDDRPRALGLGRGGPQSVLLPGRAEGEILRDLSRRHPQERLLGRRGDRGRGRRRAGRSRRAGLRQARRRSRGRDDGHQCGQGRRDRRRHGRGGADRRGERRRDAHGQRRQAGVPVEQRRRHPRRHLDRPADRRALRGQADVVDPHAAAHASTATATKPRSPPRAVTILASASARCRSARP